MEHIPPTPPPAVALPVATRQNGSSSPTQSNEASEQDLVLLTRAQAGDARARDTLAARYQWVAKAVARRFHPPPGWERTDLEAEGNIALLRAIAKFNVGATSSFGAYSWTVVFRAVLRIVTERRNAPTVLSLDQPRVASDETMSLAHRLETDSASPDTAAENSEMRRAVLTALSKLSPPERVVFIACVLGDMQPSDLTGALSKTPEALRQVKHRAINKIRTVLAQNGWSASG